MWGNILFLRVAWVQASLATDLFTWTNGVPKQETPNGCFALQGNQQETKHLDQSPNFRNTQMAMKSNQTIAHIKSIHSLSCFIPALGFRYFPQPNSTIYSPFHPLLGFLATFHQFTHVMFIFFGAFRGRGTSLDPCPSARRCWAASSWRTSTCAASEAIGRRRSVTGFCRRTVVAKRWYLHRVSSLLGLLCMCVCVFLLHTGVVCSYIFFWLCSLWGAASKTPTRCCGLRVLYSFVCFASIPVGLDAVPSPSPSSGFRVTKGW